MASADPNKDRNVFLVLIEDEVYTWENVRYGVLSMQVY